MTDETSRRHVEPISRRGSNYTDEERRAAVMQYLVMGNVAEVARATNIPKTTLAGWKKTEWWAELCVALKHEQNDRLEAAMTRIVDKAMTQLEDRIENGEATGKLDAEGNPVKLPMRGRDLAVAGAIIFDKRQLLRSQPTSIREGAGLADVAVKLVEAFQNVVQQHGRTVEGSAVRLRAGESENV